MTVTLHVCITCRAGEPANGATPPPGARLHSALTGLGAPAGVSIVPVECLSACNNGAAIALSGPGRWTYVYGELDPETAAPTLIAFIDQYRATGDGIVVWRDRPDPIRKGVVARLPPLA